MGLYWDSFLKGFSLLIALISIHFGLGPAAGDRTWVVPRPPPPEQFLIDFIDFNTFWAWASFGLLYKGILFWDSYARESLLELLYRGIIYWDSHPKGFSNGAPI